MMINQGEVCCAGTRTFVQEEIYDAFVEKSKALAEKRVSGSPLDLTTENGPQVCAVVAHVFICACFALSLHT